MSLVHESSNVNGSATSCSTTPPGVSDQAANSSNLSNASNQTTSNSTPPSVSDQAANCIRQTSEISRVQHVRSHEIPEYMQIVGEYSSDLRFIDSNVDYIHRVHVNSHSTINDEVSHYYRTDDVASHSEPGFQQQSYHPLVEDELTYEEITGNGPSFVQVAGIGHNYDDSSYNEQNQSTSTSSDASFNSTAASQQLQQVAVYDDELTGVNK